jgi:hypothetical protein
MERKIIACVLGEFKDSVDISKFLDIFISPQYLRNICNDTLNSDNDSKIEYSNVYDLIKSDGNYYISSEIREIIVDEEDENAYSPADCVFIIEFDKNFNYIDAWLNH